jgi:hypothetical protein
MLAPIDPQPTGPKLVDPKAPTGILLSRLRQTHPRLNLIRVRMLQALYRGGQHLLGDREMVERVFPKYTHEKAPVYNERINRAYYENVFAMVINQISAGLAQDPIRIHAEVETVTKSSEDESKKLIAEAEAELGDLVGDEEDPEEEDPFEEEVENKTDVVDEDEEALDEEDPFAAEDEEEPPLTEDVIKEKPVDPYWTELMENATALCEDGSNHRSFDQVIRDCVVEALVTGWAWIQADLPREDEVPPPTSYKEQEESGSLRAYVVSWSTDCVTDWEEKNGRLLWVRTYTCETPSEDFTQPRETKVHTWTIWTDTEWFKYVWEERKDNPIPGDQATIPLAEQGTHSFGRVPWTRLDVSTKSGAHLHVGDIIESLCRQYFNRQNSEAFQWSQFNYQQLYEFLGPEIAGIDTVVSENQQDPNRAKRTRSPGEVHVRGNEDRAEFVGPNMQGANVGREALQDLRDAILRVVAQMALAQDTSGAMLRRSADSKRQDSVAQEIILGAIGKKAVTMGNHVFGLLAEGRQDTEAPPNLVGYEHFSVTDAESIINMSVLVEGLDIPSATYQIEQKYALAVTHLGDNASAETKAKIKQELTDAITQDQFLVPEVPPGMDPNAMGVPGEPPFGEEPPPGEEVPPGEEPPSEEDTSFGKKKFGAKKPPFGGKA